MAKPLSQEIFDQVLHTAAGAVLTMIFAFFMPLLMAAGFAMTVGIVREIYQRYDIGRVWYDCCIGCRIDLSFWLLGVVAWTGFMHIQGRALWMLTS